VWGDGQQHIVPAVVSTLDRRLFVELDGDRWSSNIPESSDEPGLHS
jgi:hypothetical protein